MIGTARRRRDGESKVRGTTRYVGDMPVYGLLHARPVLAAESHARITSIDTSDALAVPGVVAVLTAADLPIEGGSGRAAEPLAREEIVWSGQPVALVVAETEAAAEDAAALVFVDAEPLEAVLDLEQALAADAPQVRFTVAETDDDDASAAHGGGPGGDSTSNDDGPNVAVRQRLQKGDAQAGLDEADVTVIGPLPHQLGPPGLPRTAVDAGVGRPRRDARRAFEHAGRVHGPRRAGQGARAPAGPHQGPGRADRRRVRRQADDLRAAGRGRRAEAQPPGAARVRPPRGLRRRQPGARPADRPRAGRQARRLADRDPRPDRRRPRRPGGHGRRVDLDDALGRPVPLERTRSDRAGRVHQPRQPRRLPRARRAAGGVRGRDADGRAGGQARSSTRSSSGCRTCSSRATRASTARRSRASARSSASRPCARIRSTARRCRRTRASASHSASGRAGWSPRRRSASSTATAS